MRGRFLAAVMTGVLLTTGCDGSGEDKTDSQVATLQSAPAGKSAAAQPEERPLIRPDMTEQDFIAVHQPYWKCLEDKGVKLAGDVAGFRKPHEDSSKVFPEAQKACGSKEPESWITRDERVNPHHIDLMRQMTQCLIDKGYKVTLQTDPEVKVKYSSTEELIRADEDSIACREKAFAERIKIYKPDNK
jgi:hypothetical protein